jgi:hypothetical protein
MTGLKSLPRQIAIRDLTIIQLASSLGIRAIRKT